MPQLILAIDTAFERCTAAIYDPTGAGRLLAFAEPEIGKGHAERLMGVIDDVLAGAGKTYADIGRIGVTVGPGSFTGVRVGVAAARGLALALAVPAVGISTLDALAASAATGESDRGTPVLAVVDARRGEVYAALTAFDGALLCEPTALPPEALPAWIGELGTSKGLRLIGSGARLAADALPGIETRIVSETNRIDPAILARLTNFAEAGTPPKPLYLRSADAKPSSAKSLRAPVAEIIP